MLDAAARGIAAAGKKDYDRAIADFDRAIRLNANFSAAYYNRGTAFFQKQVCTQSMQSTCEML